MWSAQKNLSNILKSIFVQQNVELFSIYEDEIKSNYDKSKKLFANKVTSFFNLNPIKNEIKPN